MIYSEFHGRQLLISSQLGAGSVVTGNCTWKPCNIQPRSHDVKRNVPFSVQWILSFFLQHSILTSGIPPDSIWHLAICPGVSSRERRTSGGPILGRISGIETCQPQKPFWSPKSPWNMHYKSPWYDRNNDGMKHVCIYIYIYTQYIKLYKCEITYPTSGASHFGFLAHGFDGIFSIIQSPMVVAVGPSILPGAGNGIPNTCSWSFSCLVKETLQRISKPDSTAEN